MGTFLERDFPRLIGLVYDAALDGRRWQAFIDGVSDAFDGAGGILYCFNRERDVTDFVTKFDFDAPFSASSIQAYLRINRYPPATFPNNVAGTVRLVTEVDEVHRARRSNCLDPYPGSGEVPADHFNLPLCTSNGHVVVLAVLPRKSILQSQADDYRRRLELLAPHFVRAIKLAHLAEESQLPSSAWKPMLEAFRACAVVIDARNHVMASNRLADQLLRTGQLFALDRSGALHAAAPTHITRLENAIASARQSARGGASASLKLASAANGRSYLVWVVPLAPQAGQSHGRETSNRFEHLGVDATNAAVLLLACDLHEATGIPQESMMTSFGLTPAEARLSSALVAGRSLADYARETGLSRNTARNQLATIFEKTGTRRQAELVVHIIGTLWTANGH